MGINTACDYGFCADDVVEEIVIPATDRDEKCIMSSRPESTLDNNH